MLSPTSRSLPFFSSYATSSLELNERSSFVSFSLSLYLYFSLPLSRSISLYLARSSFRGHLALKRHALFNQHKPPPLLPISQPPHSLSPSHSPPRYTLRPYPPPRSEIQPLCTPSKFRLRHRRRRLLLLRPLLVVGVVATSPGNPNVKGIETM